MSKVAEVTKYVMKRTMHLGHIKQTYPAGTVIEQKENFLLIDGKKYDEVKDFDILKRHNWVEPYSPIAEKTLKAAHEKTLVKPQPKIMEEEAVKVKNRAPMKIVQSDEDMMKETIDISHTKPAVKKAADKNAPMEVIQGDETAEERIARLQTEIPKMEVVEADESFGNVDESKPALNAGKVKIMTPAEHAAKRQEALTKVAGEAAVEKRGKGRPKGSLNKPKVAAPVAAATPQVKVINEVSDEALGAVADETL
jgi:hypothetical protein